MDEDDWDNLNLNEENDDDNFILNDWTDTLKEKDNQIANLRQQLEQERMQNQFSKMKFSYSLRKLHVTDNDFTMVRRNVIKDEGGFRVTDLSFTRDFGGNNMLTFH